MFGKNKIEKKFDKEIVSIYDTKAGHYREPAIIMNHHIILREIHNMMRDPDQKKNPLLVNAEDFSLFKIGDFNSETGEIMGTQPIQHIANLHDIRSVVERESRQMSEPGIIPT